MWWKHEKNYAHFKLHLYIPLYWQWQQQASFSLQIACVSCLKVKGYDNRCFTFYSLQLGCKSHVSGVQNKYQISNHSCAQNNKLRYVCHVGFSESLQTAHPIKDCSSIFNLQYWTMFWCLSPWKHIFFHCNFIKLCAKLHVSLSSRAFQEEHHIEVTYTVCHIFLHQKTFVYLSKTLNYGVCVKSSHENLCLAFCT